MIKLFLLFGIVSGVVLISLGLYALKKGVIRSKFGTSTAVDEGIVMRYLFGKRIEKELNPVIFWLTFTSYICGGSLLLWFCIPLFMHSPN